MITSRPLIGIGTGVFPKHRMIGKIILVALVGITAGYGLGVAFAADAERGHTVTLEEYIADFESYRAGLQSSEIPMAGAIPLGMIMVAGFFAIYEAMGLAVGWVVALVLPSSRKDTKVTSAEEVPGSLGS